MRTATPQTRTALRAAIAAAPSQNAWARAHGISPATVSRIRRGGVCSVDAENTVRAALELGALSAQVVTIDSTQQVIRKRGHGKPRPPRVDVYLTCDQFNRLRAMAECAGVSVPELMRRSVLDE